MKNTIESGEEMYFADKEIHFDNGLSIEGKAVYENCRIYCNEAESSGGIEIEEDGELEFINCELICCGRVPDKKNYVFYFAKSDNGSLTMRNCKIQNFFHFATGCFQKLEVSYSEFNDCAGGLFDADTDEKGTITNCKFNCRKLPDFVGEYYEEEATGIFDRYERALIKGWLDISACTFDFAKDIGLTALELEDISDVTDCTFVNDIAVPAALCSGLTTCTQCKFDI